MAAALTADRQTKRSVGGIVSVPVAATEVIYKGAGVCIDSAGRAVAAADTAGLDTMGVAEIQADNDPGAAEDINVRVKFGSVFRFDATSITQAMIGDPMYWVTDHEFDDAAGTTNEIFAGYLVNFVSTTEGDIFIPGPQATPDLSVNTADIVNAAVTPPKLSAGVLFTAHSEDFDLDNGAGTEIDRVMLRLGHAVTIISARVVYTDATSGTVAAGFVQLGTTVGGEEIVADTVYENTKAVGTITALTLVTGVLAANAALIVRHTGVAATAAGFAHVEVEYTID